MRYLIAGIAAVTVFATGARALAQGYQPGYENPEGPEIVAVYFSASTCVPCRQPHMPALIDSVKVQLARQAKARGQQFRAVFVGMDWDPEKSLAVAREDGLWDEIIVGRNFFNAGAEQYIWADPDTSPAMPQIIVYEQNVTMGNRVTFGLRQVLQRVTGSDELAAWVAQGSPIPKTEGSG